MNKLLKIRRVYVLFYVACLVLLSSCGSEMSRNDRIYYTSVSGKVVEPDRHQFKPFIVENVYLDTIGYIQFDKDVTRIGPKAFAGNPDLKKIWIPAAVTHIDQSAFSDCTSLENVYFSDDSRLEELGGWAFSNTRLSHISIPKSIRSIRGGVLAGCNNLEYIGGKYAANNNRALVFNQTLCAIAPKGLLTYTLDTPVSRILSYAFYGVRGVETVNLPNTVKILGSGAFYNTQGLKAIYFSSLRAPLNGDNAFEFYEDNTPVIYTPREHRYAGHLDWFFVAKHGHLRVY